MSITSVRRFPNAFLTDAKGQLVIVERFEDALTTFTDALPEGEVPTETTLLRTATWWLAFGLTLHDLYRHYDGVYFDEAQRRAMIRKMAAIDWSLANHDFSFLGSTVEDKATGVKPQDDQGREIINRFFGGSKAYYNLAAYIRQKIGLKDKVKYGNDYGASVVFDKEEKAVEAA